ncbi:MAG: Uma2 family endonuclease [Isosphaeraceae bacterium]
MTTITTPPGTPEERRSRGRSPFRGGPPPGRVPYRLSVEQYEAMVASGAFKKEDRLELIEGSLVEKMTKGPNHSTGSEDCWRAIHAVLAGGWHVRIEKPIRIPDRDSEPEPDVSVARGKTADYRRRHPGPAEVGLVVEVADSSVEDDRAMAMTYGGGGIPVYWLVNVRDGQLSKSTRSRAARPRPSATAAAPSSIPATTSRWSSTAARSPGSPRPTYCRRRTRGDPCPANARSRRFQRKSSPNWRGSPLASISLRWEKVD